MTKTATLLMLWASVLSSGAFAQPPQNIYRCGPDGRLLQQHPCTPGAQPVKAAPPGPSDAERSDAAALAKREGALADRMERDRMKREAADAKKSARAAGIASPPDAAPAPAKPKKAAKGGSGDFAAFSPAPPKAPAATKSKKKP